MYVKNVMASSSYAYIAMYEAKQFVAQKRKAAYTWGWLGEQLLAMES